MHCVSNSQPQTFLESSMYFPHSSCKESSREGSPAGMGSRSERERRRQQQQQHAGDAREIKCSEGCGIRGFVAIPLPPPKTDHRVSETSRASSPAQPSPPPSARRPHRRLGRSRGCLAAGVGEVARLAVPTPRRDRARAISTWTGNSVYTRPTGDAYGRSRYTACVLRMASCRARPPLFPASSAEHGKDSVWALCLTLVLGTLGMLTFLRSFRNPL